jgi:integrase
MLTGRPQRSSPETASGASELYCFWSLRNAQKWHCSGVLEPIHNINNRTANDPHPTEGPVLAPDNMDPSLLADVVTILLDCALRPEECFRLRPENVRNGEIEIQNGKTDNARRRIPVTPRVQAILDMRLSKTAGVQWVFPAPTRSGHIEPSSLKKQHAKAIQQATAILRKQTGREDARFQGFELYTLRHTCLTRWAPHMDPWTLAYLAGHRDMNITKRYVHPQEQTIRTAMERAREEKGGHTSSHTGQKADLEGMPVGSPTI